MIRLPKYFRFRNGSYYVVKWHHGKVRWKSFGRDRQEAIRLGHMFLARLAQERQVSSQPELVRNVYARWIRLSGRTPRCLVNAESRARKMVIPILGHKKIGDVRKADLLELRAVLSEQGYKPESIRSAMSDLRCMLNFAVEAELLGGAPSFKGCLPRQVQKAPDRLTDVALGKILAAAKDPWKWGIRLSVLTGIRWGELHRLRWEESVIWKPQPMLVLDETKSGRVRRVPLSPEAVALLEAERGSSQGEFVFPLRKKTPSNISVRLARQTGLRFHWHMLRHTFACRYLEGGGSMKALSKILGHSTVQMTEHYADLSQEAVFADALKVAAANTLAGCVSEPVGSVLSD